MRVIYVVARNLSEFNCFIVEKSKTARQFTVYPAKAVIDGVSYQYVRDARSLRGKNGAEFVFYGNWFDRKDASEIGDEIEMRLRIDRAEGAKDE